MIRRIAVLGLLAASSVGFGACGGSGGAAAVAHVGSTAITAATLAHWTAVMQAEHAAANTRGETERQHALNYLLSSQWLMDEAAARGLEVSAAEARQRFRERVGSYPGGESEFREFLKLSGRTIADARFVAKVEAAAAKLRGAMVAAEPAVTPARLRAYYNQHKKSFVIIEQRPVQVAHAESEAAATKLMRELASGKLSPAEAGMASLEYGYGANLPGEKQLYRAIYSATPGVLTGPIKDGHFYFVIKLTAIIPAKQQTLAEVQGAVEKELHAEQRQQALTAFVRAWRQRWGPQTSCQPGDVVWYCREYSGSDAVPENPLAGS